MCFIYIVQCFNVKIVALLSPLLSRPTLKYQLLCQKYASDDFANYPKNQELFFHHVHIPKYHGKSSKFRFGANPHR
jgi:hypothetical protein